MKTISFFKDLLVNSNGNTLLGMHLNNLFQTRNSSVSDDATVHYLEEKIEVIVYMNDKHGIDVSKGGYKMGSVSKAYYAMMLDKFKEYK